MSGGVCLQPGTNTSKHQLWLQMKVAGAERAELNPLKSREETVTRIDGDDTCSPIQTPWRSTAPSHPSRPLPRERAGQAAGSAQGCSCTQGATSAERRRCYNLERKKEQGMEDEQGMRTGQGKGAHGNKGEENQVKAAAPTCQQLLTLTCKCT